MPGRIGVTWHRLAAAMSPAEGPGLNVGAFIAGLVQNDIGVTAGRSMLRDAGARISNQAFSNLYGQVRDALGGREGLQGMDYGAIPEAGQYSTWTAGQGGQYATFVQTYVRPSGSREAEPVFRFHITRQPHTPNEAIAAVEAGLVDDEEADMRYGPRAIVGSIVTSVNRTVAKEG